MKESTLDPKAAANTAIIKQLKDNPEEAIKDFMQFALRLQHSNINNTTFHCVHLNTP